jgi:hypothetical protein
LRFALVQPLLRKYFGGNDMHNPGASRRGNAKLRPQPSLRVQRSNPSCRAKKEWIASLALAMTDIVKTAC